MVHNLIGLCLTQKVSARARTRRQVHPSVVWLVRGSNLPPPQTTTTTNEDSLVTGPLLWVQSLTPCFAYFISSNAPNNH